MPLAIMSQVEGFTYNGGRPTSITVFRSDEAGS